MNPVVEEEGWGRRMPRCEPSFGLQTRCFPLMKKPKSIVGGIPVAVTNETNERDSRD
jgi:hypothetical protein